MKLFKIKNIEDFALLEAERKKEISILIADTILKNINTDKKHVYLFSVEIINKKSILDISCESENFILILEKNLKILEDYGEYEKCAEIHTCLTKLKML